MHKQAFICLQECEASALHMTGGGLIVVIHHGRREDEPKAKHLTHTHTVIQYLFSSTQTHLDARTRTHTHTQTHKAFPCLSLVLIMVQSPVNS